jgi:hypothetical protein
LTIVAGAAKTELGATARTNCGQIIRRNIQPYLGSKRLTDLTPLDVKRWHGKLLEGGRKDGGPLSVASVKLAHGDDGLDLGRCEAFPRHDG